MAGRSELATIIMGVALLTLADDSLSQKVTHPYDPWAHPGQPILPTYCMDEKSREKLRAVMFKAIDEALEKHIELLWETWMKDLRDKNQPARARAGIHHGMGIYLHSLVAVTQWNPPTC